MNFLKAFIFSLFLCLGIAKANPLDTIALNTTALDTIMTLDTTVTVAPDTKNTITILADTSFADTIATDSAKIKPGLYFFFSVGAQFINFKDRPKFQDLLDTQFVEYMNDYLEDPTGSLPLQQNFQTVNLAFPIMAGIIWQISDMHSLGMGAGFLYDNESVILMDKDGNTYNLKYVLQAFPIFAEYRLSISPDLISLKNGDYFSLFFRYYWMLPGTEIYSSWGKAEADFDPLGSGYGIFLGYRFWEWKNLSIWGEIGYLSLEVESGAKDRILDAWNLGGVSILLRAMF